MGERKKRPSHPSWRQIFADNRFLPLVLMAVVTCAGAYLRLAGAITRGLEYDEIWTVQHYVPLDLKGIFTELATPNNHPFSSLLIKWSLGTFGSHFLALRLPCLVAGTLLIPLVGTIAWLLFSSRTAALASSIFCAFNGNLIHYSNTARGYMLQAFLISLVFLLVVLLEQHFRRSRQERWLFFLIFALAVLSIITLSTSVIFLFPLLFCHSLLRLASCTREPGKIDWHAFINNNKAWLLSYSSIAIFVLVWYTANYQQLRSGQAFGTNPGGMVELLKYFSAVSIQLVNPVVLCGLLPLLFLRPQRKFALSLLFYGFFVILCGYFFKCGPARVYTFSSVVLILGAAGGFAVVIQLLPKSFHLAMIGILFAVSSINVSAEIKKWTPVDWKKTPALINSLFNKQYYINYPPGAGYEIINNLGSPLIVESVSRTPVSESYVVSVESGPVLHGISLNTGAQKCLSNDRISNSYEICIAGVSCRIFHLKQLNSPLLSSDIVLASLPLTEKDFVKEFQQLLKNDSADWVMLNIWLKGNFKDAKGNLIYSSVYATDRCGFSAEQLVGLERRSQGKIHFFLLEGVPKDQILPGIQPTKTR